MLSPAGWRLIAVDVAAGTDHASTRKHVRQAIRRLQTVRPGAALTIDVLDASDVGRLTAHTAPLRAAPSGSPALCVRDDVEVVRVVLAVGPYRLPSIRSPGTIVMSPEDWCAITSQSASQPEELWAFLDELAELPGLDRIQANDVMTLWSALQGNGLFYDPFQPVATNAPGPWHRWAARAAADGHEAVLRNVDLPGLREWPFHSEINNGLVTVGSLRPYESVLVSTHPPVVIVIDADAVDDIEWTQTLAESILAGLCRIHQSTDAERRGWQAWTTATDNRPVRMHFHPLPSGRVADGLALVAISGRTAVFGYTPAAKVSLSPEQMHEAIGDALWCLLLAHLAPPPTEVGDTVVSADDTAVHHPAAATMAADFLSAWNALSPAARFARVEGAQFPTPQGPPAALSTGGQARTRRKISLIARSFMTDRRLRGDLDQVRDTVLLPAALAAIRQRLAGVDHVDALRVAAVQLERVWAGHGRAERDRTMRMLFGWDPLPASDDASHNQAITTQAADLALESILYDNPGGRARLDQRDWIQLLTLSAQLLQFAGGRVTAQAGLHGDNEPDPSGRSFSFDAAAHARAVLAAHDRNTVEDLRARILPTGDGSPADPLPFHAWSQLVADAVRKAPSGPVQNEWHQALAANQAMRDALGTSLDEIFAVLALAPSAASTGETIEVAVDELTHRVAVWSGLDPLAVAAAIGQLTLTPAILQAEGLNVGRREGRAARLATRPFVQVGEHSVIVMPRRIDAAGRLILAYVSAARLPWPGLPTSVVDAFARWSQARQIAFEIHLEKPPTLAGSNWFPASSLLRRCGAG